MHAENWRQYLLPKPIKASLFTAQSSYAEAIKKPVDKINTTGFIITLLINLDFITSFGNEITISKHFLH